MCLIISMMMTMKITVMMMMMLMMIMMRMMLTKWNKAQTKMLKATWKVLPQKLFNCLAGKVSPVKYKIQCK